MFMKKFIKPLLFIKGSYPLYMPLLAYNRSTFSPSTPAKFPSLRI